MDVVKPNMARGIVYMNRNERNFIASRYIYEAWIDVLVPEDLSPSVHACKLNFAGDVILRLLRAGRPERLLKWLMSDRLTEVVVVLAPKKSWSFDMNVVTMKSLRRHMCGLFVDDH